jgi:hypothetical protein
MNKLNQYDLNMVVARLPEKVKNMLVRYGNKLFLAGGMIRSCIAGEKINDVDLFTQNKNSASDMSVLLSHEMKIDRYVTDYAYTIRPKDGLCVQFIHRWTFDNPIDCVKSFDFTIAQAAVWYDQETLQWDSYCGDTFYQDLAAKRLVYTSPFRNEDAGGSMLRVLKFYQNGYRIPLTSLGAVIARLMKGVDLNQVDVKNEARVADVVSGLLFEVDPNSVDRIAYIDDVKGRSVQ